VSRRVLEFPKMSMQCSGGQRCFREKGVVRRTGPSGPSACLGKSPLVHDYIFLGIYM
jgi:hypothetical protein